MSKEMSKEEALKAFQELLESEGIEEIEVSKIFIDENGSFKSKLVIRVVLKK